MNQRRLFLGISVSDATRKALSRAVAKWEELPIIPTRPENLHVTMLFLGSVEDEDIFDACERAEAAAADVDPFDMTFTAIDLAPDDREPDMIWLRGEPSEGARMLRNGLERAFTEKRAENRSFRPHITLAKLRKKQWNALPSRPRFPISHQAFESVTSLTLFESVSEQGRRRYVPIDEFPLGR